jgi:hypothetical protein
MRRWAVATLVAAGLSACGSPAPASSEPTAAAARTVVDCLDGLDQAGSCSSATSTDGAFRLELVLPRLEWTAAEPITGTSILSTDGAGPTTIYGSGSVLNFAYAEVGGARTVEPVWTADCATHELDPATPITTALDKSGAASADDPDSAWLHSFITAPDVRLPAGTWDVTTVAIFTEGEGCDGPGHTLSATLRLTVTE